MTGTVILDGQEELTSLIDGDLDILIEGAAAGGIENILDGSAALVQIIDGGALLDCVTDGDADVTMIAGGDNSKAPKNYGLITWNGSVLIVS